MTLFLREAAQLTIESGDKSQTLDVQAGVSHVSVSFAPGKQKFVLRRGEKTLIDKTGEHEISALDTRSRFNYFAGSAQAVSP